MRAEQYFGFKLKYFVTIVKISIQSENESLRGAMALVRAKCLTWDIVAWLFISDCAVHYNVLSSETWKRFWLILSCLKRLWWKSSSHVVDLRGCISVLLIVIPISEMTIGITSWYMKRIVLHNWYLTINKTLISCMFSESLAVVIVEKHHGINHSCEFYNSFQYFRIAMIQ